MLLKWRNRKIVHRFSPVSCFIWIISILIRTLISLSNSKSSSSCMLSLCCRMDCKEDSGLIHRSQSRLFLLTLYCLLYSQHVSSFPAVVHVSLLRLALTAAGAVGYKGKLESTQRAHTTDQAAHSTKFILVIENVRNISTISALKYTVINKLC